MKKLQHLPLAFIIAFYVIFILRLSDYVPMWDGWDYASLQLLPAVTKPFSLFNFDLGGHASFIYAFFLGLPWYSDPGNHFLLHTVNIILFVCTIIAFDRIIINIYPDNKLNFERLVITSLYAFFPIITANLFNTNIDFGILIFFILLLDSLVRKRYLFAIIYGTGMVFSKDTGVFLYAIVITGFFLFEIEEKSRNLLKTLRNISKELYLRWGLFLPIILFFIRTLVRVFIFHERVFWGRTDSLVNPYGGVPVPAVEKMTISYLYTMFIIQFNWILSIFATGGAIEAILHRRSKRIIFYYFFLLVGFSLLLLQVRIFTNPRYFLPLYPLLIIMSSYGFIRLISNKVIRRVLMLSVLVLFFLSNFRTFDPISKKLFGTFAFGSHEMLNMTGITGECCGFGRDQLVYNLEYMQIHFILNDIFADIKPDEKSAFIFTSWEGPYVITRIDKSTFRRTLKIKNSISIEKNANPFTWQFELLAEKPQLLYFIAFPNVDNRKALEYFKQYYSVKSIKEYEKGGYAIKIYTMVHKL